MKFRLAVIFVVCTNCAFAKTIPKGVDERVLGGNDAFPGQFPWNAGVFFNRFFQCGGALISEEWVMTSAECLVGTNLAFLTVQLGSLDSTYSTASSHDVFFIVSHPGYTRNTDSLDLMHHNNIALIRLKESVLVSIAIRPIELPALDQPPILEDTSVELSGWGAMCKTAINLLSPQLQYVELQTMDVDTCILIAGGNPSIDHKYNVCTAGYSSTTGKPSGGCAYDHGSPLVQYYSLARIPLLIGVVSFGECEGSANRKPSIYASTFGHRQWINMVSGI